MRVYLCVCLVFFSRLLSRTGFFTPPQSHQVFLPGRVGCALNEKGMRACVHVASCWRTQIVSINDKRHCSPVHLQTHIQNAPGTVKFHNTLCHCTCCIAHAALHTLYCTCCIAHAVPLHRNCKVRQHAVPLHRCCCRGPMWWSLHHTDIEYGIKACVTKHCADAAAGGHCCDCCTTQTLTTGYKPSSQNTVQMLLQGANVVVAASHRH